MQTATETRRTVHQPRPFAEGLIDEPADGPRVWTAADWKRAEFFRLRPPVGQTPPTRKPRPVAPETETASSSTAPAPASAPADPIVYSHDSRRDPKAEDAAWWLAYCLGRDGIDAMPRAEWPASVRVAFNLGLPWGQQQAEADHEEDAERYSEMTTVLQIRYGRV